MFAVELLLGSWAITSLIAFTTTLLLYWFSIHNHDYWKKRGVPFDKPKPFVGSLWDLFSKPLHQIEMDNYVKYGAIYGHFEGNRPLLSVGDPALLKDILVKDFPTFPSRRIINSGDKIVDGILSFKRNIDEWKRLRSIVTPTFTTGKIKKVLGIINDSTLTLLKNFENLTIEGKTVDAKKLFGAFSMDVICSSAFSTKIDSHNNPNNEFVRNAKSIFTRSAFSRFCRFVAPPGIVKLLRIQAIQSEVTSFFRNATLQIIEERKRTGQTRNDFLQLMMDTAKEVSGDTQHVDLHGNSKMTTSNGLRDDINPHILKAVTSKNLSLDELVSQCVIFFIAGYDTTAVTLSFTTYQLALNPDIQDKLRTEVDETFKENKGDMTYEAIQSMKYLDNVVSEVLRLYPPSPRLERVAEYDYKLGNTGIIIPKDMIVSIPIYGIHRDPKYYPNPEKFDPDRFSPEERAKREPYTYLPFGEGPRHCVAMRFALMEVKTCLTHILLNFRIKRCPETKVPLDFTLGQGLIQPEGIILQMEKREDSPLAN